MLSLLSGEILRLCLACSTKLTTACKPRCFCSWGPPPRVSACWSPRSSHRASGSPTPGEGMVVCMYVCMYVWMDGCMDACMYVWMYGCTSLAEHHLPAFQSSTSLQPATGFSTCRTRVLKLRAPHHSCCTRRPSR